MKKVFILTILLSLFIIFPFVSAEMIIDKQPDKIYNLGDTITIPITVMAPLDTLLTDDLFMYLICNGKTITQICVNEVTLSPLNEGDTKTCTLTLRREKIGETTGECQIKIYLSKQIQKEDILLTDEFKISNVLTLQPNTEQKEYEPEQSILIFGNAIKENGHEVNGFIDMEIIMGNSSENIIQKGTINNGMYSMNITLPVNLAAGNYLVKLNAYEMAADESKTNKGFVNYNIAIKQVPTYLELAFEKDKVEPGTNVKVKAILHDQTGEKINSKAIITIKKGTTEIQIQEEKATDEYLEFPIAYNEPPSNWTVFAMSDLLTSNVQFTIIENKEIEASIANETITFTNTGNIPYNDTVTIRIGNASEKLSLFLGVDETKEYKLKASEGEHEVEVIDENGESKFIENIIFERSKLTGNAIQIKDASQTSIKEFFGTPLIWIFIVLVILAIVFIFLRKAYKRNPYGKLFKKKVKQPKVNTAWENRAMPLSKNSKLETSNKANLSLSIKGNKQDISIVNVSIRNLKEVQSKKGNAEEALQKIINGAENKKAFVYENQDNLFFILTPSKTRTLQNESIALKIAQDAREILSDHNRIAKYKLDFGISIECGSIVEKIENGVLEFMSLENLMTRVKRISSASQEEVLLGEKIKERLTNVRTEKQDNGKTVSYKIKDMKYHDEEHSRFIKSFLKRAEDKKGQF